MSELDAALRRRIYDTVATRGYPPAIADLAERTGASGAAVRAALERLAAGRILVLQPGSGEILMAPPFSAVPTPFLVESARHACYANCAWDALGVPVMLATPARVVTACGCCGDAIVLDVEPDRPLPESAVIHFAVPAARWWDDLVFT